MAIVKQNPNRIYLGGTEPGGLHGMTEINEYPAIEEIMPGMLIEYHESDGALMWGVHDSADDPCPAVVALDQPFLNQGIDDPYPADDLVLAGALRPGSTFYGIIPSGQDIAVGDRLQSNGDGKLKAAATGDIRFVALDGPGAVNSDTRIRVEVL